MLWWGKTALWTGFALVVASCGYTLGHRLKQPFQDPRGVYVPVFINATDETAAEYVFTNALIREMQSRGNIVLSSRDAGGLEMRGTITGISYSPTASTETGFRGLQSYQRLPTDIQVTVNIDLHLFEPKSGKVVWSGSFSGFRRIPAPSPRTYSYQAASTIGLATQSLVESYYPSIAQDIMRDAYDEMVELF